jgi:hypothetical protein
VDVLVILVAMLNGHPLEPIHVIAHPLEVIRRDAGQLGMGQVAVAGPPFAPRVEGERSVDDGLFDVGAKLAYGPELPGQVASVLTGHVPADDLGLMLGGQGIGERSPEA